MRQTRFKQNQYPYFIWTSTINNHFVFNKKIFAKFLTDKIFFYRKKFGFCLYSFAILPSTVMFLIKTKKQNSISKIMQCLKYRTASDIRKYFCQPSPIRLAGFCRHDIPLINFYPKRGFHSIWQKSFNYIEIKDRSVFDEKLLVMKNYWRHLNIHNRFAAPPFYYQDSRLIKKMKKNFTTFITS